ncbi:ABC transporter ATP-binding protein [Patulibacter sp. NPDC049589]|uniref:ABC transporter ATP-binding protein n=1 Tax=Patulibacter sp. NPDC049589 TaxID=3154731 RepID=UPI0034349234
MTEPLLHAEHLRKRFDGGILAVDDVSLTVRPGETVGIVGESGCGKSTTAKLLLRLLRPDAGTVRFAGHDLGALRGRELRALRAQLQLVPQHPQSAFNPRMSIGDSIAFNLQVHGTGRGPARARARDLLERVGVPGAHAAKRPHELSGGQLQRAAIARAIATEPRLVVCDEAVSALDKSVQAQVLNLLDELQRETGVAFLFISHDLAVVEHVSDRVVVMYLGRVVEEGPARELWETPAHPYTSALLSATPDRMADRVRLTGEPPSPGNPPSGCCFRTRCPVALDACAGERPPLVTHAPGRTAACVRLDALPAGDDRPLVAAGR